jgi:hypothetical protein
MHITINIGKIVPNKAMIMIWIDSASNLSIEKNLTPATTINVGENAETNRTVFNQFFITPPNKSKGFEKLTNAQLLALRLRNCF